MNWWKEDIPTRELRCEEHGVCLVEICKSKASLFHPGALSWLFRLHLTEEIRCSSFSMRLPPGDHQNVLLSLIYFLISTIYLHCTNLEGFIYRCSVYINCGSWLLVFRLLVEVVEWFCLGNWLNKQTHVFLKLFIQKWIIVEIIKPRAMNEWIKIIHNKSLNENIFT